MTASQDPFQLWKSLPDDELNIENVGSLLVPLKDDLWVAAACADRLVRDPDVQRALLDLGISRTESALARCRAVYASMSDDSSTAEESSGAAALTAHLLETPSDGQLCRIRRTLVERLARLNTFVEMCKTIPPEDTNASDSDSEEEKGDTLGGEEWEDDPWADEADSSSKPEPRSSQAAPLRSGTSPVPLPRFLLDELGLSACTLAASEHVDAVKVLRSRHPGPTWPYRYGILESIPEYVQPSEYYTLLPSYDSGTEAEVALSRAAQNSEEWTERTEIQDVLGVSATTAPPEPSQEIPLREDILSAAALSAWYLATVNRIISSTGMIDIALELVQHGASQGIPALDELGEDLSLLSRLVYDAPSVLAGTHDEWTVARWRALNPDAAVRAYLQHATPSTVVGTIRTLVLPYLYVLEARAERAGTPDPALPTRALETYVLGAPLELVEAIFAASKPTLPAGQRLLQDEQDVVRLALAVLYGSERLDAWSVMSAIFECLPAWNVGEDEDEAAQTALDALGILMQPSTARAHVPPSELLAVFRPLPAPALSRTLDVLDVHLESGEILSRWGVPAPLRWFLQSQSDVRVQRAWAERMARQARDLGEQVDTPEEWESLLDNMLKLAGKGAAGLRGAFGLIPRDEVIRIFFSGLMSAGDFEIARTLLHKTRSKLQLEPSAIEDICLACSREFYDNASSGNYKVGDMKLAYDCLSIPPPSETIVKEKEFIEATSRICSFNVMSRPGMPIEPIEIRLTKDRLSLVSRVLSSTPDAYKHTQVILELAYKLGYRADPVAEVRVLAMLADTALQAEDFAFAYETSLRMVEAVQVLRATDASSAQAIEASEVAWVASFQLGRQPEFSDISKKLILLGRALELCPPERIPDILSAWRRLEAEAQDARAARAGERRGRSRGVARAQKAASTPLSASLGVTASSLAARLQARAGEMHMPGSPLMNAPDAAALASKAFGRVAGAFPFSVGRRDQSADSSRTGRNSRESSISRPGSAVPIQASRALQKGIGWLIGADEQ